MPTYHLNSELGSENPGINACGRNRRSALKAITDRVLELRSQATSYTENGDPRAELTVKGLFIYYWDQLNEVASDGRPRNRPPNQHDTYVSVAYAGRPGRSFTAILRGAK